MTNGFGVGFFASGVGGFMGLGLPSAFLFASFFTKEMTFGSASTLPRFAGDGLGDGAFVPASSSEESDAEFAISRSKAKFG